MGGRIGCAVVLSTLALAACDTSDESPTPAVAVEPTTTLKIVSDLPLQGSSEVQTESIVRAIKLYLEQIDHRAGDFAITYESFDDSVNAGGYNSPCSDNAQSYVDDEQIVGVVGTFNSGCAKIGVQIANPASLVYVSPANTAVGLTHEGPGSQPGEPDQYYPSGVRTYARVVAPDDVQGGVAAEYMKHLGVTKVYVLDDRDSYGMAISDAFEVAARRIGLEVAGHSSWNANAENYRWLMKQVKASGADGIYIGGISDFNGDQLLQDKVAIVGDNEAVTLMVSDGFVWEPIFEEAGADAVEGAYGSAPVLNPEDQTGAGGAFLEAYAARYGEPEIYTAYGAAAAQVLLDAIARSDGTRQDIAAKLIETNLADGILGPTAFDANGDIEDPKIAIYRAESSRWRFLEAVRPSDLER